MANVYSTDATTMVYASNRKGYRPSSGSTISFDSDIRFTRKKLSTRYRCGCFVIAGFLVLLLIASGVLFVIYTYVNQECLSQQHFRATIHINKGDSFTKALADVKTIQYQWKARYYAEHLNALLRRSTIGHGFVSANILAFDGIENVDLIIHFNIIVDSTYTLVGPAELKRILLRGQPIHLQNVTVDDIQVTNYDDAAREAFEPATFDGSAMTSAATSAVASTNSISVQQQMTPVCSDKQIPYCDKLPYNGSSYPNLVGHVNIDAVQRDLILFRELVDSECYDHAYQFVCSLLQPQCLNVGPCRAFCMDFMRGCRSRVAQTPFRALLDCSMFAEPIQKHCYSKPDCVKELGSRALSSRLCDGVVDCADMEDERDCTYCPESYLHCGVGRRCIPKEKICDGHADCPDSSDEQNCVHLQAHDEDALFSQPQRTTHSMRYLSQGVFSYRQNGQLSKVCADNFTAGPDSINNSTVSNRSTRQTPQMIAQSICRMLTYHKSSSVTIQTDSSANSRYVTMVPQAGESLMAFISSDCPKRSIMNIQCEHLDCGHRRSDIHSADTWANHGEWPWSVSLFRNEVHNCDGSLVAAQWVVTSASCFQGQPESEWTARLAATRLQVSHAPWEQTRTVIGLVKSPVEGSTLVLVKLREPVLFNDFVRPICFNDTYNQDTSCYTLGWARNRDHLVKLRLRSALRERCENVSIAGINSMCMEAFEEQPRNCDVEEFAGSPLMCETSTSRNRWTLVGVTNWRIACASPNVTQRPRAYDKIASNINWIANTISHSNDV